MKISYLLILGIIFSFSVSLPLAFAASVSVPQGTSVPGCEATSQCYIPYEVVIPVGGQVVWSNDDSAAHTVTSGSSADGPSGVFDSSLFMAGTKFSHNFSQAGVYPYFCMVHPWMNGIVKVGDYEDSDWLPNDPIEVIMNDSEFYLDVSNQVVRATVEFRDFSPSDGQYFMKVTHLPTGKTVKDSEIYPKAAGNDLYSVKIAYPLSESDIIVGGQALLGEYEILVYSEKGVNTGSARFTILETAAQQKAEPVESKIKIEAEINKITFDENETITVTGFVNDVLYGNTISARVLSPSGNIISIEKAFLDKNGGFTYTLDATNLLFEKNGDYTISLLYGIQDIRKDFYFSYIGNPPPKPEPIPDPEPIPAPTPKADPTPKVEQVAPKVEEKIITPEIKPTPQKSNESDDYTIVLIIVAIIIIAVIVGAIAAKKRNQRHDPMSEDYDYDDYDSEEKSEKKMEW